MRRYHDSDLHRVRYMLFKSAIGDTIPVLREYTVVSWQQYGSSHCQISQLHSWIGGKCWILGRVTAGSTSRHLDLDPRWSSFGGMSRSSARDSVDTVSPSLFMRNARRPRRVASAPLASNLLKHPSQDQFQIILSLASNVLARLPASNNSPVSLRYELDLTYCTSRYLGSSSAAFDPSTARCMS